MIYRISNKTSSKESTRACISIEDSTANHNKDNMYIDHTEISVGVCV